MNVSEVSGLDLLQAMAVRLAGSVKDADGTLIAHAACTCAILPKRAAGL